MEFFATTIISASAADLQRRLTISELPHWCASIEKVLSDAKSSGEIYCVWGTFHTNREDLSHGVRFSLPGCPNALQWTVTTGHLPDPQHTVIHLTINRTEQDQDFIDSIQQFVDEWRTGLEAHW
ncbi:hypothetical protein TPL01_00780 [Sulfuriferula plumbiphila]|uniref:Uncharacterized protein n=1 Tax=Sulfuriferula plumbiphila TaxID=171865 RepID=A0A512L389_9PROT|nr:hypothetical protein [Sulfuriferula plumbiphila]BBP02646.1 hypothetical protein SFPGR_00680 [Sulfuriferula plumbiphila]GEP28940.1 hypothetical protein TPL01_00780 [Sulfuriferula plumbiphila]